GMVKVKESVKVLCKKCNGSGVVSASCSDCHGRGKAVNQALTEKQGVPVLADCKRCGGRGYERLPSTEAFAAICQITDALSLDTWKKSVKPFYDQLITKFDIEEAWAEKQLKQITR
ncbi:MAG: antitermination protein, partial [Hafnia sp.]